jgi:hypothetical protein
MSAPLDDPPEFTDEQLQAALRRVGEDARREAFGLGRPVMIVRDGRLVLLYENGAERDAGEPLPIAEPQRQP